MVAHSMLSLRRACRIALMMSLMLGQVQLLSIFPAEAKVFYAQDEAMQIAFPEAENVEALTFILNETEKLRVEALARAPLESKLFTFYRGSKGGQIMGYAAIESSVVRTLPAAFLVVLTPKGQVVKTVMLAFHEPLDYLPSERWLEQFANKRLDPDLWPQRGIAGIVGSTLSVRAVTMGVRKVLALFRVLIQERS